MAIYDFDGFEDYTTAGILREHSTVTRSPAIVAGGRNGGSRLQCNSTKEYVIRPIPSDPQDVYIGFYFQVDGSDIDNRNQHFLEILGLAGIRHVCFKVSADGSITAQRCDPAYDVFFYTGLALLGTTAAGVVQLGVPLHLVIRVYVANAPNGVVQIWKNGENILDLSGLDTMNGAAAQASSMVYGVGTDLGTSGAHYFDDLWIASSNLGDCRVDSHFPTSDGTHQDATPSAGADHYAMVDEAPEPDDDTTYVTLAAADDRDSYGCEDFKNNGANILGVMVVVDARKEDAGTGMLAPSVRSNATDYDGDDMGFTTSYGRSTGIFELDPQDDGAWTAARFNAAEFGVVKSV